MLSYPSHPVRLGQLDIRRALPIRARRTVGPWCFLDRYGPLTFTMGRPMDVAPHPHIGIQTVSWVVDGEVLHRDSLGFESTARPGAVNVMTSGRGIAHSEETPRVCSGVLSGVQLWVALPDASRDVAPAFEQQGDLPRVEQHGGAATVIMGAIDGARSKAAAFSPLVAADIDIRSKVSLPLNKDFEHALFVLGGSAVLEDQPLAPDILYYLEPGRDEATFTSRDGARVLLIGGTPFQEPIVMWWNFVARSHEEIAAARAEWEEHGARFGEVRGYDGPRVPAPPLHHRAKPPAAS